MPDDESTEELRADQLKRELAERDAEARADDADTARAHERRAEKARYLREKLGERAESERALEDEHAPGDD